MRLNLRRRNEGWIPTRGNPAYSRPAEHVQNYFACHAYACSCRFHARYADTRFCLLKRRCSIAVEGPFFFARYAVKRAKGAAWFCSFLFFDHFANRDSGVQQCLSQWFEDLSHQTLLGNTVALVAIRYSSATCDIFMSYPAFILKCRFFYVLSDIYSQKPGIVHFGYAALSINNNGLR